MYRQKALGNHHKINQLRFIKTLHIVPQTKERKVYKIAAKEYCQMFMYRNQGEPKRTIAFQRANKKEITIIKQIILRQNLEIRVKAMMV